MSNFTKTENGWVNAVFVGCDRVAANGDVANANYGNRPAAPFLYVFIVKEMPDFQHQPIREEKYFTCETQHISCAFFFFITLFNYVYYFIEENPNIYIPKIKPKYEASNRIENDLDAYYNEYISVTPLTVDKTNYTVLNKINNK